MIYDISPPITDTLKVFPGDTPPSREVLLDMKKGDFITLSTFRSTVHVGSHVDAPSHYGRDARTIDQQPLDLFLGECEVFRLTMQPGQLITVDMLPPVVHTERVLFYTGTYPNPLDFNLDFAAFDPAAVDRLGEQGVKLVGIDTPSVDPATSKELLAHKRFLANDVAILEGIVLKDVPAGRYELVALPLALVGFDASPVRAILRTR